MAELKSKNDEIENFETILKFKLDEVDVIKNGNRRQNKFWSSFGLVRYKSNSEIIKNVVCCFVCKKFYLDKGNTRKNLYKHKCYIIKQGETKFVNKCSEIYYDIDHILTNIRSGLFKMMTVVPGTTSDTKIWNIFGRIADREGNILKGITFCRKCRDIFKCDNEEASILYKHRCYIEEYTNKSGESKTDSNTESKFDKNETQDVIDVEEILSDTSDNLENINTKPSLFITKVESMNETIDINEYDNSVNVMYDLCDKIDTDNHNTDVKEFTKNIQNEINTCLRACAEWAIKDCIDLKLLNKDGFQKFLNHVITISAKYGQNVDILNWIPNSSNISKNIFTLGEKYRKNMIKKLNSSVKDGCCVSIDLFEDKNSNLNYLSVTIHYIEDKYMRNYFLSIRVLSESNTNDQTITSEIIDVLNEFGIKDIKDIIFLINLEIKHKYNLLNSNEKLICSIDILNKIINNSINNLNEWNGLVKNITNLVNQLKESGIDGLELINLKSFQETKDWFQFYELLKILNKKTSHFNNLDLKKRKSLKDMITHNHILKLMELFDYVDQTVKQLEESRNGSLYLVLTLISYLKRCFKKLDEDCTLIKKLSINILDSIETEWINLNISIYHKIAIFLFPPANKMVIFNEQEKEYIKNYCKKCILNLDEFKNKPTNLNNSVKMNQFENEFLIYSGIVTNEQEISIEEQINNEIINYSILRVTLSNNFDVMKWWFYYKDEYPNLYKLSKKIFSIPAGQTHSKLIYSAVKQFVGSFEYPIDVELLNNTLFLNLNQFTLDDKELEDEMDID